LECGYLSPLFGRTEDVASGFFASRVGRDVREEESGDK
jgi:hypothetical protein